MRDFVKPNNIVTPKEEISYAGRSKDGSLAIPADAGDS